MAITFKKTGNINVEIAEKDGLLEDFVGDVKQTGTALKQTFGTTVDKVSSARLAKDTGEQGGLRTVAQITGLLAGGASNAFGDVVEGVVKTGLTPNKEQIVRDITESAVTPLAESESVKNIITKYQSLDEKGKRDVDAVLGIASLVSEFAGGRIAKSGGDLVLDKTLDYGGKAISKLGDVSKPVLDTVANTAKGASDLTKIAFENVGRLPSRISTNVGEMQAQRALVQSLPTKVGKEAAQDGIDVSDVKQLYTIPQSEKTPFKKLLKVTQDFADGKTSKNPIEIVGKPIINRIKVLESKKVKVGKRLGDVANKLGTVSQEELVEPVFSALKKVQGLNGIEFVDGALDFSNTVLASGLTKADREAITKIFTQAIEAGTGKQKHLLRQELFEVLGGKKKSLSNLTDTQEKAFEAIRKGLSDVLESKNSSYKALSNQYRKIIQPMTEMRKLMKGVSGADEDILEMSAGLLARRLTSNAGSNPQIRQVLRNLDNATRIKGKTSLSVERLQDFYNILDKYYNIAGRTTLQGQVQTAGEKALQSSGLVDSLTQGIKALAGKSEEVKRKALERLLEEALN